jgi:hypothetical protein
MDSFAYDALRPSALAVEAIAPLPVCVRVPSFKPVSPSGVAEASEQLFDGVCWSTSGGGDTGLGGRDAGDGAMWWTGVANPGSAFSGAGFEPDNFLLLPAALGATGPRNVGSGDGAGSSAAGGGGARPKRRRTTSSGSSGGDGGGGSDSNGGGRSDEGARAPRGIRPNYAVDHPHFRSTRVRGRAAAAARRAGSRSDTV